MADRDGLKDLIKTVQALTEKIDSSSRQLGIEDEVSKVFKRNDSNKTTGNSSSENSRPLSSSTLASTSTTTGFSGFSSTSRFRRLMNMRKIGNNITKKCDKRKSGPFMCDVILLAGPNMTSVPKQGTKLALIEQGHILSAVQFDKNMTEIQVQSTIIEAFGDKLLVDVDIEILMSAHNKLVKPTLAPGQGIDGVILNRLFRSKPVYVAPSRQLIKMDCDDEDEEDQVQSNSCQAPNQPSNQDCSSSKSSSTARVICEKCSCTFSYGEQCIRCIQNEEYQQSLSADQILSSSKSKDEASANDKATDSPEVVEQQVDEPVDVEQLRGHRLAHLEGVRSSVETVEDNTLDFLPSESSTSLNIAIHRTTIKQDLIREFKDDSVLESEIQFKLINEMGEIEAGVGVGVAREVYSLFWGEFSISMTIGERERVPFVRHDHYIEDWESIGRILVKGYTSVDYFPTFLSKAFICFCLFGSEVTDEMFLNSFKRYLSKSEEDLIESIIKSNELPEDTEELLDFLERFKCRSVVKKENIHRIILEIARQELVQKPHVMISAWQPILQNKLTKCLHFLSIERVMDLYEELIPTPKKVLRILSCDPKTDPQRDAFKYLQRYIRGLDNDKLSKFLQFTTGMDVMSRYTLKIAFLSTQGFSSRPIAHTCAPMLELPTAYSNFVELREEFENILNQKISWDIDIV